MNYIREAENRLRYYSDLKKSLKNIEREITKLKWSGMPKDIEAINYDGMPKAKKINDEMINVVFKLKCYSEMKEDTIKQLNEIDYILEDIEKKYPGYGEILKLWYIDDAPKEAIAGKMNYSPNSRKSIYKIKNDAIRIFAIRIFGIHGLEVV